MKIKPFSIQLFIILLLITSCNTSNEKLLNEIDALKTKWVPDKREGILELELVFSGANEITVTGETNLPGAKNELFEILHNQGFNVDDQITLLPDTTVIKKKWALVNLSVANLRGRPAHSSELVSQSILGTPVKVLKEEASWVLVQTPDNYISWTNRESLSLLNDKEFQIWRGSKRVIFVEKEGVVRNEKGEVVCDVVLGSLLQKIAEQNDKVRIGLPTGQFGYLPKGEVHDFSTWKEDTSYIANDLVRDAKKLLGLPYMWGGASSKALDCSGFVKTIFFQNRVVLTRDASQQIRYGQDVVIEHTYDLLKEGDLLFFGSKEPYKVTHVGLYIGDSEYIQEAGRVKISSLDSTRTNYVRHRVINLLGARRYIGIPSQRGVLYVKDHSWY